MVDVCCVNIGMATRFCVVRIRFCGEIFLAIDLPRTTMDRDREGVFAAPVSSPRTSTVSSQPISTVSSPQNSTVSSFNNDEWPMGEPLPASRDEWKKHAIRHKLVGGSIFDLDKFASASKISYKQFLQLRVLWTENKANILANENTRRTWLRDKHYLEARRLLTSLPSWKAYLEVSLDDLQIGFPDLGTFQ
jgi:hypothetical protein